jgi:hypothetical protein
MLTIMPIAMPVETTALVSKIEVPSQGKVYRQQPNFHRERPTCTHCRLLGHVIEKCYKLNGYPPGYTPGYKTNRARTAVVPPTQFTSYPQGHAAHQVQEFSNIPLSISQEQCKKLLALIQPKSLHNPAASTSTQDHMFSNMAGNLLPIYSPCFPLNSQQSVFSAS